MDINKSFSGKTNMSVLKIVFFLIPCFTPAALLYGGGLKLFLNGWRVVAFTVALLCVIIRKDYRSKQLLYTSLFSFVILCSTIRFGGNINSAISIAMLIFTLIAISEKYIRRKPVLFFDVAGRLSLIILLVDTLQVYLGISMGANEGYTLLGGDNFAIFSIIPFMAIIVIRDLVLFRRVKKPTVVLGIFIALAKFYTFAVTSMLAFIVLIYFLCIANKVYISKKGRALIGVLIVVAVILIGMNFSSLYVHVASLFGKGEAEVVGHGRLTIWALSIKAISSFPVLGHGVLDVYDETVAIAGTYWPTCSHTHNYILELLFRSGVLGCVLYLCAFVPYFKVCISKYKDNQQLWIRAFMIANLVLWVTDSYYAQAPIYILVVLAAHFDILSNKCEGTKVV